MGAPWTFPHPLKKKVNFWPNILSIIFLLFLPGNFLYTLAVKMVRCLCFYTPFLPLENFVLYPPLEYQVVFGYLVAPPSEQMREEKCSYILSNHPGHGEHGEIKMGEINWPDKTCSFFPVYRYRALQIRCSSSRLLQKTMIRISSPLANPRMRSS